MAIDFFADLFRVETGDDDAIAKAEAPDPVANIIQKTALTKFNVPEFPVPEKPHADGVFVEKDWRWTYQDGQLVKSENQDAAGRWQTIEERAPRPAYVTEDVARILGISDLN